MKTFLVEQFPVNNFESQNDYMPILDFLKLLSNLSENEYNNMLADEDE